MSKRQWIWLVIALVVFAGVGVSSVMVNTWSAQQQASVWDEMSGALLSGSDTMSYFPEEPFIARVDVEGTIVSGSSSASYLSEGFDEDYLLDYIDRLIDCPWNEGILLYIDSGGGEMIASDDLYLKLMDYKEATGRPVYAYFGSTACSGAYYIAMAADEIWANRNCLCVNIGVYISTYNLSGLFENYGIEQVMIRSSDNKGIGAVGVAWTEEQLEIYQSIVDLYYDQFLDVVATGRGMTKTQVKTLDDGREMLASQALAAGFIDGIARYEEYEAQVLGYYDGNMLLYQEEPVQENLLTQVLQNIYGAAEGLLPKSDGELLQEFVSAQEGIVVMAYAG
jgi:protease-4